MSKGGLLYHFKSKDALLQAMIQRIIDEVHAEKELFRTKVSPGPNLEARLCVMACWSMRKGKMREIANGLLAASAENPNLLQPVRDVLQNVLQNLKQSSEDLDASLLAWLAVEGLNSMVMHGISPFSDTDCDMIASAVDRLLEKGIVS